MFEVFCGDFGKPFIATNYNEAVDMCWRISFDKIQELFSDGEIPSRTARKELSNLNKWFKELKLE